MSTRLTYSGRTPAAKLRDLRAWRRQVRMRSEQEAYYTWHIDKWELLEDMRRDEEYLADMARIDRASKGGGMWFFPLGGDERRSLQEALDFLSEVSTKSDYGCRRDHLAGKKTLLARIRADISKLQERIDDQESAEEEELASEKKRVV